MVKLYTEGRIKLLEKRETWVDWEDKSKGKMPQYLYYIQTSADDGTSEVIQVRSKNSYDKLVDVDAVFTLGYWTMNEAGVHRSGLTLLDAKAAKTNT